jgi:hypothetical protein
MPPIEIPGLKEEIEKDEFSSWSDDDLIQFMYEPGGSLPNLQDPTPHDLTLVCCYSQIQTAAFLALATRKQMML